MGEGHEVTGFWGKLKVREEQKEDGGKGKEDWSKVLDEI